MSVGRIVGWVVVVVVVAAGAYFLKGQIQKSSQPEATRTNGQLATYLAGEHRRVAEDAAYASGVFTTTAFEDVMTASKDWLGKDIDYAPLASAGFEFKGGGRASVPGEGASAHTRVDTGGQRVSIFLQNYDIRDRELEAGKAYTLAAEDTLGAGTPPIVVWRKGGVVYFIVAEQAEAMSATRSALGIPEPSGKL